jgi:hypothetical protein
MSDSDEDLFGWTGQVNPREVEMHKRGKICSVAEESRAPHTADLPDFLQKMLHEEKRRKKAEERVAKAHADIEHTDILAMEICASTRQAVAELNQNYHDRQVKSLDDRPFFLYCPPCQPVESYAKDFTMGVACPVDLCDTIRDLRGGRRRALVPLPTSTWTALAALAIFHSDSVIRTESRETLCTHLKTEKHACVCVQSALLCALCDIGFPEEQLGDLRSHLPDIPYSLVRYTVGARVKEREDASQPWRAGYLVGPVLPQVAGRGARFKLQLDSNGDIIEVVLPSEHVRDIVDDVEESEDEIDSDDEREITPLSPAAASHLYPLLLLLQPILKCGVANDTQTTKAWFSVLVRVLLHTSNVRRTTSSLLTSHIIADLVDASSSNTTEFCATAGSLEAAAAACIEALLATVPLDTWPLLPSQLSSITCSYVSSQVGAKRWQAEDLLISCLRRRWPVTQRAAEVHREIVDKQLRTLLCPTTRSATVDGMDLGVQAGSQGSQGGGGGSGEEVGQGAVRRGAEELLKLLSGISFMMPDNFEWTAIEKSRHAVFVNGERDLSGRLHVGNACVFLSSFHFACF